MLAHPAANGAGSTRIWAGLPFIRNLRPGAPLVATLALERLGRTATSAVELRAETAGRPPRTGARPIRLTPWEVKPAREPHRGYDLSKRAVDVAGGSVFLVAAAPVVGAAALAVAATTRSWPFYVQRRVGQGGREFAMLKVRTMRPGADREVPLTLNETGGPTFKAAADPRITKIGKLLRRTSIDELPQLVNVVLGQLALVGPRPGLPDEARQYTHAEARRLSVKPGLTGIWQVSGRSDVPFRRWMAMDRAYIRKRSLLYDLGLLARTPWTVVSMRGAR